MTFFRLLSPFILILVGYFPATISGSILSYECISILENTRLTGVEESAIEDSATLSQCHHICRERGYDTCSVYVFDSEQEICKMYTNEGAERGDAEEVLWNTLVRLKPDCFDDNLITGRRKRAQNSTNPSYMGGQWADWQAWGACSVTCGKGQQKRKRLCKTYQPCQGQTEASQDCVGPPCAQISQWGPWSKCSVVCGGGTQTRTRSCPSPTYGACGNVSTSENQACNPQSCCTEWTRWSQCSVTCGQGTQKRTRRCMVEAANTPTGYASQEKSEVQNCTGQQPSCSTWGQWAPWSQCSASCGGGNQTRQRVCSGAGQCPGNGTETKACNTEPCPEWGPWSPWTPCSDTCGGGWQIRTRNCTQGGKQVSEDKCPGDPKEKQLCNTFECPGFGQWQDWTACSQTCGGGTRTRGRECVTDQNVCSGSNATLDGCTCTKMDGWTAQDNDTCNGQSCPSLTPWSEWSPCSVTCGDGTRTRNRTCSTDATYCTPDKANTPECQCDGGGTTTESGDCKQEACPTWQPWQEWSACSVTCGNGTQTRTRTCSRTDAPCDSGSDTDTKDCDAGPCYTWSSWSEWGDCTALCGGGSRSRARQCPTDGGCPGLNDESDICNMMPCPDWGDWSPWSSCSVTCGGGDRTRTRSCPLPKSCSPGSEYEMDPQKCSPNVCPSWSEWAPWSACSKTCGQGNRARKRTCSPDADGCLGTGENVEPCFDKACTLTTNWSQWSPCTATCGGGTQTRSRVTCPAGPPTCPIEEGTQACNPQACPQWSNWGPWGTCSKTCGGGQRVRQRTCPVVNGCVGSGSDIDPTPCNNFGCGAKPRR